MKGGIVAVVPARGGSKSVPRKNLRALGGHPLVAWAIAASVQASTVDRVIVTTEDEEIAEVSARYGAEVPFIRPAELAEDLVPDLPVFQHVLRWLAATDELPEILAVVRPTTPLRPLDCIDEAVRLMRSHPAADSVRSVVPSGQNPFKMWTLGDDGRLQALLPYGVEGYNQPRQVLPATYWQTGHIDLVRSQVVLNGAMSGTVILPTFVEPVFAHDLDTAADWERAEWTLSKLTTTIVRPHSSPASNASRRR